MASLVFAAFFAAMTLFFFFLGVVIALSGHFNFAVGAAIGIPPIIAIAVAVAASKGDLTLAKREGRVQPLLRTVGEVLDATTVTSD